MKSIQQKEAPTKNEWVDTTSSKQLVSCIMPTYNRRKFVPLAIEQFLAQDYSDKELIIIDDGKDRIMDLVPTAENIRYYYFEKRQNVGLKRNRACELANGTLIAHWDDDDWCHSRRISVQVALLENIQTDLVGVARPYYYDMRTKTAFQYKGIPNGKWVTYLMYRKHLWQKSRYCSSRVGEDTRFISKIDKKRIHAMKDEEIGVCVIHGENVCPKQTRNSIWRSIPVSKIEKIVEGELPNIWTGGEMKTPS